MMIVALAVTVQPAASVTVNVYDPGARPVAVAFVVVLLQLYVYGDVPPAGDDAIDPLLKLHVASVGVKVTVGGVVVVKVVDAVAVHPMLSVIVTLYVPATTFVNELVVAALLHT